MAKLQKSISFSNAYIDVENMQIVETEKNGDETGHYDIMKLLNDWDGIFGVSISIRSSNDISDGD